MANTDPLESFCIVQYRTMADMNAKGICFRFKVKQPHHESDLNALHVNVSRTTFYILMRIKNF